jgi:sporulation protein YlmC with PRC-barrel domain
VTDVREGLGIDVGADVVTSDGEKVGTVSFVVVRPPSYSITDIVVGTGFLGRDVVVSMDRVAAHEGTAVRLNITKDDVASLDDYVEAHYDRPSQDWFTATGLYYPGAGTLWPAGTYYPMPTSVEVNAPAGTVGISEGLAVVSSDGHHIGSVHSVRTGDGGQDVEAIVVRQGTLFHHDTEIPMSEVSAVEVDGVVLKGTKDDLQSRFAQ